MSNGRNLATYGLTTLTALVIANMIGTGIFTTSGFTLASLQTPERVVAAWVLAGFVALSGAIAYGALATVLNQSGGEYLFLARWVHPAVGFLAGWVSLLVGFTGAIALNALALEAYFYPADGWLAAGAILFSAFLHGVRRAPGAWAQNLAVGLKLILLGLLLAFALGSLGRPSAWQGGPVTEAVAPFSCIEFARALMWISLSYAGFNAAVYVAGEAQAKRHVPRALVLGTAITTVLYVCLNAVFVYAPSPHAIANQEDVAAIAAQALGSPFLSGLTRTVIPLALFTSISAMMLAGPRIYAQMAADGYLPAWLRFQGHVPRQSIVFQAALAIPFVWFSNIKDLITYLGFTLSLSSAAAVACVFLLHLRRLAVIKVYQLIAAAIYVFVTLVSAAFGASLNPWQALAGLATLGSGYVAFHLFRRAGCSS